MKKLSGQIELQRTKVFLVETNIVQNKGGTIWQQRTTSLDHRVKNQK